MTPRSDVRIVEVGPRDGLQNERIALSVAARVNFIHALAAAGLKTIEAGSFVSPARVPQMAGSAQVLAGLRLPSDVETPMLVPNARGFAEARAAGVRSVAVFAAASDTFSHKNIGCGISESLTRYAQVVRRARDCGVRVRGYVSCALGCPYEGRVNSRAVVSVANRLAEMGCDEIAIADTIGVGTADAARNLIAVVAHEIGMERLAIHFHDTFGQALANVLSCLDAGVSVVDASAAGLGGCPFAPGASGNLATEDLVYMLNGLGVRTGVDFDLVAAAGRMACADLGVAPRSRAASALISRTNPGRGSCSMAG
jgi:hydroxymethylglutaryl-CoA lyase